MTENPYASSTLPATDELAVAPPSSLGVLARGIFLAWEKLRLIYIAILGLVTLSLVMMETDVLFSPGFWGTVLEGAVFANVCFFAGPVIETYVTWLGFKAKWLRPTMFLLGMGLSCLLTFGVVGTYLLPTMQ